MAKVKVFLTAAVLTAVMLGCTQLFEFNLFSALDKASVPKASDLEKMPAGDALDLLEGEADSDAFFDALKNDPDGKAGLEEYLKDTMNGGNGATGEDIPRAALLYSDINLKTTGADDVVNNLVKVLDTSGSGGMGDYSSFGDFWNAVAPQGADAATVFEGLNQAYDGFNILGGSLTDTDGTLDGPEGANMGEAAQNAVVAFMVYKVMDANDFTEGSELAEALNSDQPLTMPELSGSDPDFTNISNIVNAASPDLANLLGIQ